MTRKKLITAFKEIAQESGFDFHTGFEYRIAHEVRQFPAAWLYPLKLVKTEGRQEGIKYYDAKIVLLALPPSQDELASQNELERLERAASKMCLMLGANECVRTITDTEYTPAEFSLTAAGEVSISLEMKVQMPFCNAENTACGE